MRIASSLVHSAYPINVQLFRHLTQTSCQILDVSFDLLDVIEVAEKLCHQLEECLLIWRQICAHHDFQ